ncbi:MAG TPA: hypothetical protein VES89_00955, partial [Candidatus Competibacteraceae bacterium]|nr:hypothetical protein [Candidatus Competibacteraceae bacterium]
LPHHGRQIECPSGLLFIGLLLFTFSGEFPTPVRADDRESMSEQDFLRPFPVVIAPTQLVQSTLEAPAAVTIIDREMIKAMNVREIPELM